MKKNLTFLIIGILAAIGAVIISCTPVSAQDTSRYLSLSLATSSSIATYNSSYTFNQSDTISVISYCLINPKKLKFKWVKLYGVTGINHYVIYLNGLMLYQDYLMPDRKTPVKFKVIYSVNN